MDCYCNGLTTGKIERYSMCKVVGGVKLGQVVALGDCVSQQRMQLTSTFLGLASKLIRKLACLQS